MSDALQKTAFYRSVIPTLPHAEERTSAVIWIILLGGLLAHLGLIWQVARLPQYFQGFDWFLSVSALVFMAGLAVAYLVGRSGRQLVSLLVIVNSLFIVLKFVQALFGVGTSERLELELVTTTFWGLTLLVLGATMQLTSLARWCSQLLPLAFAVLAVLFTLTPQGQATSVQVWFGLIQQLLAGLIVLLLTPALRDLPLQIDQLKDDQQLLTRLAFFDDLTGLNNRTYLDQRLQDLCAAGEPLAVLFLDLDGFKSINDTLGHATGDEVLKRLAARLKEMGHATACLARVSGDEFVIVLTGRSQLEVTKFADWVVSELSIPMHVEDTILRLGVSIGISIFPEDADNAHNLLLLADRAMYAVKRTGKNGFRFYGESLLGQDEQRQLIENELRGALQRNELYLMFQPICDLKDGEPHTIEVLLRWEHPTLGRIGPDVFIPIAEESGLIAPIGDWVITSALAAAQVWQAEGFDQLRLAVNVSPLQLMQSGFVEMVEMQLDNFDLPARVLEIEVTEGVELHDHSQAMHSLLRLRELGVVLSLDDFGTGFASLSRLNELPVQVVKIDKLFISDLTGDVTLERTRYVRTLISAMVSVASSLELALVVEGVETAEQRQQLLALGCRRAQGYYFAKPMTEAELRGRLWLQDWSIGKPMLFIQE